MWKYTAAVEENVWSARIKSFEKMTETKKNHKNKFLIFFSCVATAEKFWLIKRIVNLCAVVSVGLRLLWFIIGRRRHKSQQLKKKKNRTIFPQFKP